MDLRRFPYRTVVLATLLWLAVGFALTQSDSPGGKQKQTTADPKSPEIGSPKASLWDRTNEDPTAFFTMALAALTAVLAGTAAGQIYYLRRSDETARRTANAALKAAQVAEDTLIAGNRAWVKIRVEIGDQPLTFSENGAGSGFPVICENIGNAPALRVNPQIWMLVWKSGPGEDPFTVHERLCADVRAGKINPSGHHNLFPSERYPDVSGFTLMQFGVGVPLKDIEAGMAMDASPRHVALYVGACVDYVSPSAPSVKHQTTMFYSLVRADHMPIIPANGSIPPHLLRGCYELSVSRAAFLSMRQTKATMCRSASVLA